MSAPESGRTQGRGFVVSEPDEHGNRFIVPLGLDGEPLAAGPEDERPEGA